MAKSQNQKTKILYLERMMRETGENHVITMQEILAELLKYDICAERKSIYDDFEALRSFGMDVRFKRGKNGGYYLAGQVIEDSISEMDKTAEDELMTKPGLNWDFEDKTMRDASDLNESGKTIKLQFTKDKEKAVREYFGNLEECKEKNENFMTGCVTYVCDPKFFGWLTAMGKDVKILKPKKLGQSYREYLKAIAKAYK